MPAATMRDALCAPAWFPLRMNVWLVTRNL